MASLFYMCSYFCVKEKWYVLDILWQTKPLKILHILAKNSSRHF